jgi:hypothetical protein
MRAARWYFLKILVVSLHSADHETFVFYGTRISITLFYVRNLGAFLIAIRAACFAHLLLLN